MLAGLPAPGPVAAALLAALALAPARVGETGAERLHRKGVHCMEEIERPDCAIEHFEALLDERTDARELVTDALLRLVKLYEKQGRDEDVKAALRRFWDAGKTDVRRGHLPYTARFLPKDFGALFHANIERLMAAPLAQGLADVAEYVMTCDPTRRDQLDDLRMLRKAERRAAETGKPVKTALADVAAEEKKEAAARERRAAARAAERPRPPEPVFIHAICPVARALGDDTTAGWTRGAFALSPADPRRSAAVIELPDLPAKLAAAAQAGRITPVAANTWALAEHRYQGGAVHLAMFETGELVVAPAPLMPELAGNHARGRRTLPREVDKLVVGVPIDAGFFLVASEDAMTRMLGASGGRRGFLQMLLPRPKGLQVAGVAHEYFGLFLRMPTDNAVKAAVLVGLARRLLASQAEADEEAADFLRLLDVTQATDKRALLLSYVLSRRQIEAMLLR